eukprot:COSAG05_NODE_2862_length_2560_cov_5.832588_4_plen_252_part_00
MSWNDAREYCKSRYQELASIHSKEDQQIAMAKCATRSKPNKCEDRWESTKTCCADAVPKCLPGNNQNSDGSNGCWIGLHQPFGHGEREVVAFDNRQQCNVDQRMPGHLLDIEISKIRVETVGGKTHMWSPEDGYFLSKEDGCTFKGISPPSDPLPRTFGGWLYIMQLSCSVSLFQATTASAACAVRRATAVLPRTNQSASKANSSAISGGATVCQTRTRTTFHAANHHRSLSEICCSESGMEFLRKMTYIR